MSIVATDLVLFASANMPADDVSTNGGAIDLLRRVDYTQIAANDTIQAISDNAGDTQNITITARAASGSIVTETKAMNGITAINFSTLGTVERILQAELASVAVGIVTVRRTTGATLIRTIPATERGFMALFRKTASDPSVQKDYYTKCFWKNTHGTLSLLSAVVKQNADPDARITHCLASAVGDSTTAANRVTAPGSLQAPGTFDDTDKTVPGTDLAAGTAIGVWFHLLLPAGDAAHRSTYTTELDGQTT